MLETPLSHWLSSALCKVNYCGVDEALRAPALKQHPDVTIVMDSAAAALLLHLHTSISSEEELALPPPS